MDLRQLKALEIAAQMRLARQGDAWLVPSQSGRGLYHVTLGPGAPACTCDDFALRQKECKHILAARLVQRREAGAAPALGEPAGAAPARRTYRQDWPAYNEAQTTEKRRFRVLLAGLCRGLGAPARQGPGRPRTPLADVAFACAYKVYSTLSGRRFQSDLRDAQRLGYVAETVHYNTVSRYLEGADLTPALHELITRSSLPLRAVETTFAPDSTGFSTSRFVRWYDEKYGGERSGRDWVKAHLMTGAKTNVVTAVRIEGRDAGDSPQFRPLLEATAEHFTVKEVSADKAYSAVENVEAVFALGAFPYIPFKENATGGAGGLWQRLYCYYHLFRQEFLEHYHRRSNVESTINMVKAKFRDHVRSKTDTAMANEVLCKFLCHNLCCVIQSQCELGIAADFWAGADEGQDSADPRDVKQKDPA